MRRRLAVLWLALVAVPGCPAGDPEPLVPPVQPDPYEEIALEIPPAYLDRQAEYLQYCFDGNGPGEGGLYGQVCRVALGGEVDPAPIEEACAKVAAREDTADFKVAALVRLLYLDRANPTLEPDVRALIEDTVLEFKYWIDEPGQDQMCYWSENHQALFHSNELLAGQLFPDAVFPNNAMAGAEHVVHAERLAERWLDFRGRLGFSEWHSNVYFNEDIPALANLAEFAQDETIRTKAAAVLDLLAYDMLNNYYQGYFATVHGRTYESKFIDGLKDSTTEALWIMTGLGEYSSDGNFSATFLATSENYGTPALLAQIGADVAGTHEHRQRDGIDVGEGPDFGVGYEDHDDIIFWAGMSALVAPEVIEGTVAMLDELALWDGFLFGDLPDELRAIVDMAVANDSLVDLATDLEPLSRGIALQGMDTYLYRTPDYQLAGAQDYHGGTWAAQTQMWQATLDGSAFVFTSYPTDIGGVELGTTFAGEWIGSWLPRATFDRNVGVIQYRREPVPLADTYLTADHSQAFFPRDGFDEIREQDGWTFGRKGDGYVALWSQNPTSWADDNTYELNAEGEANVWIVELGRAADSGSFDAFVDAIAAAAVSAGETVVYESPSIGTVEVGWEGPMTVDGVDVELGPFPRWANDHAQVEFGSPVTRIDLDELRLELDFEAGARRLLQRVDDAN